jgi:accessory colonization factor AcfC
MPKEEDVPVKASPALWQVKDDGPTVRAINAVPEMISVVVHEGLGHATASSTGLQLDGAKKRAQIGVGARVKI